MDFITEIIEIGPSDFYALNHLENPFSFLLRFRKISKIQNDLWIFLRSFFFFFCKHFPKQFISLSKTLILSSMADIYISCRERADNQQQEQQNKFFNRSVSYQQDELHSIRTLRQLTTCQ